jgi:hypothetical protein
MSVELKRVLSGDQQPNHRVNLSVRPVTSLARSASAVPVQPAGYAERWADNE